MLNLDPETCAACGRSVRSYVIIPVTHYGPAHRDDKFYCLACVAAGKTPCAQHWVDYCKEQIHAQAR